MKTTRLFCVLLFAGALPLLADPLTLTFSGTINDIVTSNASTPGISDGTPFSISVAYDPADVVDPNCGATSCIDPVTTLNFVSMTIGGFTEDFASGQYQNIQVIDTTYSELIVNALNYTGQASDVATEFGMSSLDEDVIEITLEDPTGTALTSNQLPDSPDLSLFTEDQFAYAVSGSNADGDASANIYGDITSASESTPEPASAALFILACVTAAGCQAFARRRRGPAGLKPK